MSAPFKVAAVQMNARVHDLAEGEGMRRSSRCTLKTRRPELYGAITELL